MLAFGYHVNPKGEPQDAYRPQSPIKPFALNRCRFPRLWLTNCYFAHDSPPCWAFCDAPAGPTSERESLPTTLHAGTATHLFPCIIQIARSLLFYLLRSGAPGETRTPDPL